MRKFRITVEGIPYEVEVEEISANMAATPVFAQPAAVAAAPQAAAPVKPPAPVAKSAALPATGTQLKCPMPGTVLGLKVESGTKVKRGETILVLEAMKMENDIAANADGVVTFSISKGSTVNTGDLLAVIA